MLLRTDTSTSKLTYLKMSIHCTTTKYYEIQH